MTYPPHERFELPDALEIVRRVARFLEEEVFRNVPDERLNYRVNVAARLLRLAEREISSEGQSDADGWVATGDLISRFGGVQALTERLQSGELSITDPEVFEILRDYTQRRVAVASPGEPP